MGDTDRYGRGAIICWRRRTWCFPGLRLPCACRRRNYWLCTTTPAGAPHAAPVWGVVTGGTLYLYSELSQIVPLAVIIMAGIIFYALGRTTRQNVATEPSHLHTAPPGRPMGSHDARCAVRHQPAMFLRPVLTVSTPAKTDWLTMPPPSGNQALVPGHTNSASRSVDVRAQSALICAHAPICTKGRVAAQNGARWSVGARA